jgi:SAM-dependent methyltransferase
MSSSSAPFDSLAYWRARHDEYMTDLKGVGNVTLTSIENERIYVAIDKYVAAIGGFLKQRGARRVLDLGCGIGMLANAFISNDLEYTGVDISETAIKIASEKHPDARFQVGNIADLPFAEPFDIIVERTVFIHLIEDAYWAKTLRQVKRTLAPKGVFILFDTLPKDEATAPQSAMHVRFRRLDEYEQQFSQIGLKFDDRVRADLCQQIALTANTHLVTHT